MMGDIDQSPDTDVDAIRGEFTLSSYGAGENVNDDSEVPALQDEQFGDRFSEDFDFIKEIASGSFGRVIEAFHRIDKTHYAIKIIQLPKSKDVEKKVLGEVKIMANLKDDYIVGYNTAWIDPSSFGQKSHLYIQMELCEKTLNDWLFEKNTSPRDCIQVLDYFRQIVLAIDVIHSKSFIHRDLKPSNIFISKNGVMKVGDFGLVTVHSVLNELEQDAEPGTSSIHSRHKYTRLYASPEQLEGKCYDCKADIFSLGLIYLELCIPLQVEEREEMFKIAREGQFPREERFPDPRWRDLLNDMLVKNPAKRSTAKDILKHPVLYKNKNPTRGNQTTIFHNIQAKHLLIGPGSVMNINSGPMNQTKKIKISPKKPLTKSQEQPSTDHLLDIKEKVGQDWKDLGRRLNFDDAVLEQMHEEYKTLGELIYQILRSWKQRENMNATRERLAQVFMKLDRGDLADILAHD